MGKNDKMGKKSKLALAAKKCHPIKSYFATKIPTTPDEAGHPTPNRNCSCAVDNVMDAIADAGIEASVSIEDVGFGATLTSRRDVSGAVVGGGRRTSGGQQDQEGPASVLGRGETGIGPQAPPEIRGRVGRAAFQAQSREGRRRRQRA
jgi:hypothetical protein